MPVVFLLAILILLLFLLLCSNVAKLGTSSNSKQVGRVELCSLILGEIFKKYEDGVLRENTESRNKRKIVQNFCNEMYEE